jgi:hypothetical protein
MMNLTPFDGTLKSREIAALFDHFLPRNFLHVALPPHQFKFA